jgi:hypothetical protein
MLIQSLFEAFFRFCLASRIMKGIGALLLGGATLSWVVDQVSEIESCLAVHVTEPEVEVIVGDQSFFNDRPFGVIECRLRSGRHLLRMRRGDRILYEEWFTAHSGENVVLVAHGPR